MKNGNYYESLKCYIYSITIVNTVLKIVYRCTYINTDTCSEENPFQQFWVIIIIVGQQ